MAWLIFFSVGIVLAMQHDTYPNYLTGFFLISKYFQQDENREDTASLRCTCTSMFSQPLYYANVLNFSPFVYKDSHFRIFNRWEKPMKNGHSFLIPVYILSNL